MPVPPSSKKLKQQETELLEAGDISIGEPFAPITVSRYRKGVEVQTTATGRKFPLLELRKKLIQKHKTLMRLHTDEEIDNMGRDEICDILSKCKSYSSTTYASVTTEDLKQKMKQVERTRTLWMWQDHSTVLSYGLVLVLMGVTYDPLTFYTDDEVSHSSHHNNMSMQEIVEQGEIYILAHCSSTSSDQAGLIPERVACLESLSAPVVTSKGIPINDRLMFFKGDKQAAWFEAGISRGGNYCCVSCTCHKSKFADITKVFNCKGRLFKDTQTMAIAGIHGKKPNCLNFSEGLNTEELRQELVTREIYEFPTSKQGRLGILKETLCGVQRVPSFLLLNPTADPASPEYNLADYCVLPFEPLHDLKGYLSKMLPNLPKVVQNPALKAQIEHYLTDFFKKTNLYGSDYREAIIQVMHIIAKSELDHSDPLFIFIATIIKISEIAYSRESKHCPRQCLQFYNCTFLHQELYNDLFAPEQLSIYCHAMFFHGPEQHEFVCN